MSEREWKPGDVADINGSRVMRLTSGRWGWVDGVKSSDANTVRGARPLVVIDPEDMDLVCELFSMASKTPTALQAALREFANPTPPKPDEPQGLGAVVEAINDNHFVRVDKGTKAWRRVGDPFMDNTCYYADIDVVRVLSPGYTEDGAS